MSERDEIKIHDPITVNEAAQIIGISPRAVRARCERRTLTSRRLGRDWIIERAAAEAATPGPGGAPTHDNPAQLGENEEQSS